MEINVAEFRVKCFKILDEIEKTRREVIITKRGRPVAKLTHIEQRDEKDPLLGALSGYGKTMGDLTEPLTVHSDWEVD